MKRGMEWSRGALGLAMIAMGIAGLAAERSRGDERGAAMQAAPQSEVQDAAAPSFVNAKVETRAAMALNEDVRKWVEAATQAQWLGYSVAGVDGDHTVCCGGDGNWNDGRSCGTCRLEDERHGGNFRSEKKSVKLEGPRNLVVLYRAEGKKIGKIRVASEDCTIDAGGLRMVWLTGANAAESVAVLASFVNGGEFGRHDWDNPSHGALTAIALHGDAAAEQALESFTAADKTEELRKQAAFWLGAARGAQGEQWLARMAKSDPSAEVRSHVTFALSISKEPAALEEMIRMARQDESAHVRGQALFWLAQKAGRKASSTITGAIENDPDTEVKKKAVFALSQMPAEEGVPKLIEVAQNNRNPEVRKQAMFWLGQTHDARALEFFEKILAK